MAKRKKKVHHEEEGGEAWLLPYSDLMTLLLAVFIVLFAVSKVDQSKAESMAEAFGKNVTTSEFSILPNDGSTVVPLNPDITGGEGQGQGDGEGDGEGDSQEDSQNNTGNGTEQSNLESLETELGELFEKEGVNTSISTHIDDRGLIISLDNAILFDSGSAKIKPANEDTLLKIAATVSKLDNYIRIEGHTDNIPISTSIYPSNWELSAARATSVVKLFTEKYNMNPEKLVAVGYAEFRPVADNSTEKGRAQNRRIDVIILNEKFNSLEEQLTDY